MSITLVYTIALISIIGIVAAIILYYASQKFMVHEDPRIDLVDEALPGANCGGCGFAGCRAFAEACVTENNLADLFCPVGGNDCMTDVAKILGLEAIQKAPRIAVLRCNGTYENRTRTNNFDGAGTCSIVSSLYGGETNCSYGCHSFGDCVKSCDFDALFMDEKTGLPVVVDENCVACGACVEACPTNLFELRKKMPKFRRVYVSCQNCDKGAPAKKSCSVACIGCGKCVKVCPFDAITLDNNLAFIDSDKCKLCRKCAPVCPTNAIIEENFPPKKVVKPELEKPEVEVAKGQRDREAKGKE